MHSQTKTLPGVKSYRLFDGDEWKEAVTQPEAQVVKPRPQQTHFSLPGASCCAYTLAGNICGRTPSPFLDLQRGGLVCAEHHRETEGV